MSGKERFYSNGQSGTSSEKRAAQLKAWENSPTNRLPGTIASSRRNPMIKFGPSVVFMAAAHSGDTEEVRRLVLSEGADVNSVNKDGLTSLHQVHINVLAS